MSARIAVIASTLFLFLSLQAAAETVVIVNPVNTTDALTREQVVDIYMGRRLYFPNGNTANPIDLHSDSPVRAAFYRKLLDRSIAQVSAYWARLQFSGRANPPRMLNSGQAVLKEVRHNREAIAYIDSSELDNKVKVVYRLK